MKIRIDTMIIFLVVLTGAILPFGVIEVTSANANDGSQIGGIFLPDQLTGQGFDFPWDLIEGNEGYFLFDDSTIKIEAKYSYIDNAELFRFIIYDDDPSPILRADQTILPTDEIRVYYDSDNNQIESEGDYQILLRLGHQKSEDYFGRFNGISYEMERDNPIISHEVKYNDQSRAWEVTILFALFLTDNLEMVDRQYISLSYQNVASTGIAVDNGFDLVPNLALENNPSSDLYYLIKYPSFTPDVTIVRNVETVLVPPSFPRVTLDFRVSGQAPISGFKFTEVSPLNITGNNPIVTGERGSYKINQNLIEFNLDNIDVISEFQLVYKVEVKEATRETTYVWPPVLVEYDDFTGKHVQMEVELDTEVIVTNDPSSIILDEFGNILNNTDSDLSLDFTEKEVDFFSIIIQIAFFIIGSVAVVAAIKGTSLVITSRHIRKKFEDKATGLVYDIIKLMRSHDREYLATFMRRGLEDVETFAEETSKFRLSNPSSEDVVQFYFGKFKKQMLERVEIFFSEDPQYHDLREYIIKSD